MFIPVRRNVLRWGTPDPEGDWIMYAHLIFAEDGCILIDPPLVPGLIDSVQRLGKIEAVILTTLDHTRGVNHICRKTGATLLIPDQVKSKTIDPDTIIAQKELKNFQKYDTEEIYGLRPFRITVEDEKTEDMPWIDEFALLSKNKELIVGDIAIGSLDGRIIIAPEWFPHDPPHSRYEPAVKVFKKVVHDSEADTLLASHGSNIYGELQRAVD